MGASRSLIGFVTVSLFAAGCVAGSDEGLDVEEYDVDVEAANIPPPAAPPGSECALIQRGTLGQVQDTDIAQANGANYAMGWYPQVKVGLSQTNHWGVYRFELAGIVPAGKVVNYASLNLHVGWNANASSIRAHRVLLPWSEATATWGNFGGTAAWSPDVAGSFNANGSGYKAVELTSLVQGWHAGTWSNNGVLLEEDPVANHQFYASEGSTLAKRPGLWVCWTDAPPPACGDQGAVCETAADCCDDLPCNQGTCGGAPICADAGQACGPSTPCCVGLCNEGECPVGGGGGGTCNATGAACAVDAQCCSGSCWDGMCVDAGACITPDSGLSCSPWSPCCDGGACVGDVSGNFCWYPDELTCVDPGQECSPDGNPCCWGKSCLFAAGVGYTCQ